MTYGVHCIDDSHEAKLKTLLKLGEGPELPEEVQRAYWDFKGPIDRLGGAVSDNDLVWIVLKLIGRTEESESYSFLNILPRPKIHTEVVANWKGQWCTGVYRGAPDGMVRVVLDGDTTETREFDPADVKLKE